MSKAWKEWGWACGGVVFILALRWIGFESMLVPSGSMVPALFENDHIFVSKFPYGIRWPFTRDWFIEFDGPERGDVVVFRHPETRFLLVSRVVGLPGDSLFYENGILTINGEEIGREAPSDVYDLDDSGIQGQPAEYVIFEEALAGLKVPILLRRGELHFGLPRTKIPSETFFVMGDNRDESNDSRFWGVVPRENLHGRVERVWLSCGEVFFGFVCNPRTIRWERIGRGIE